MLQDDNMADTAAPLMARIARGDRTALAALFEAEAPKMLGVALRIVRRRDLAEDVVQDAFLTIWRKSDQYDAGRGHPRAWMLTIVRNKALNLIRDGARMETVDHSDLDAMENRLGDADHAYQRLPETHALKHCLGQLDGSKRRSILLCYVTGMSHGEVAATLGAPLGTVKAWIRRGMASLQECLK